MNLSYSIDRASRVVTVHYAGIPNFDEWADTIRAAFHDPDHELGFGFLLDRRLVETAPTADYIRQVVHFVQTHRPESGESRWAVVVRGPAPYGMVRMAQALAEEMPFPLEVFTDLDKAQRWLREEESIDAA